MMIILTMRIMITGKGDFDNAYDDYREGMAGHSQAPGKEGLLKAARQKSA